ncbi:MULTISPECIES: hypothetical protein [unclassified Xanthobacter]|uniref:hypothetical protein n=1 Tax=unclassified Xanthobacter TaxID=2623496 RepID=UPI001EDEB390|nr:MULTISPECIES: hypothetical protein [unclassified Xanthobacter]
MQPAPRGSVHWDNLLTVGSATILIATEALATAVAAAWALAGLFNLGEIGEYALMVVFGVVALYGSLAYFRKASAAEPLRG